MATPGEPEAGRGLDVFDAENSLEASLARGHPVVFLDVTIAGEAAGRLKIELFSSVVPRTAENFRQFCTGELRREGQPLGYRGCPFHRVMAGFMAQGGDIVKGDGTGSLSIYGTRFSDEAAGLELRHRSAGLLSMANSGPNTNGSQFFVTLDEADWLDGKHVVFGRLLDNTSMLLARRIEAVPVSKADRPTVDVEVANCGQL